MGPKKSLCAFCSKRKATTRDHIPPKCLYPESIRPGLNLITVPSCPECNNELSGDEEHFRNLIVTGGGRNLIVDELFKKVLRGLERAKGNYKLKDMLAAIKKQKLKIGGGKEKESYIIYPHKDRAFCRVMRKIGRGLFYHHMHFSLPSNYKIETKKLEFLVPPGLWNAPDCCHCHPQILRYSYTPVENEEGWFWIINLLETRTFTLTMLPAQKDFPLV
jgi:hypothetical protein